MLSVQKPGRYLGGEYGSVVKEHPSYRVCVGYPDLYEIGMSNLAVQIIYGDINSLGADIACERVFAPAPDFEELLTSLNVPLFSLETHTPLCDFDLLAFSMGYELTLTNLFALLRLGYVPPERKDRGNDHPVLIVGGPGATNPIPLGRFVDAVYLGEWEDLGSCLVQDLAAMKKRGACREDTLEKLSETPGMWLPEKESVKVDRQIYKDFPKRRYRGFVVPSIQTAQDHGVIEIMRGCPSGCRFCHAGMIYRPQRERSMDIVLEEADYLINQLGYREVTLSSLSTADYSKIGELIGELNRRYASRGVSFSLPSLRINTFTLNLLDEVSRVRKSGLTFAVETPLPAWQRRINKDVREDRIVDIMLEAKKKGWRHGKLYFMVGLPVGQKEEEAQHIVEFCRDLAKRTGMKLNVNIGTFVPKPHTPFQWSPQLTREESYTVLSGIKHALEGKNIRVHYHTPLVSFLEGVLSRGEERAGDLFFKAFQQGARLDSWDEYLKKAVWEEVLAKADWDVENETCRERKKDEVLPWQDIHIGVTPGYLKREYDKSREESITGPCSAPCDHPCGVCHEGIQIESTPALSPQAMKVQEEEIESSPVYRKMLFLFSKQGKAVYLSHINIMTVLERAFQRAGITIRFSEGFNPKPRMEFAQPLSLGVASEEETMMVELDISRGTEDFVGRLNRVIPAGLWFYAGIPLESDTVPSLMKTYWGSLYRVEPEDPEDRLKAEDLPEYMRLLEEQDEGFLLLAEEGSGRGPSPAKYLNRQERRYSLTRLHQYAKDPGDSRGFTEYPKLYRRF
ncbi:MAG: TIGR03960 family B12-binding radical SAM protein [Spirochaetales bacterium]|nr:TIGR03960 family B12-binding radical SAM protein [Spirochaetales bacterium]